MKTVFPPYEMDIIQIYRGAPQENCTRAAVIARMKRNLPAIEDKEIQADVMIVLRKLNSITDTEFRELLDELDQD